MGKAGPAPTARRVLITKVEAPSDIVYIEGTIGGVALRTSIRRAELDALPNRAAKMLLVARLLAEADDLRLRSPFAELFGDIEV